jgi:cold shock CspA family protein/ribosome-associated translation inhibitor RaiA
MTLIPTQITFRGLPHSDALEADIRRRVAWLEHFYAGIVRCDVLVELPHRHRQAGQHFHVKLEVTVSGGAPIVVTREPSLHGSVTDSLGEAHHKNTELERVHRFARVAVHEAFDAARRRLEDFARKQRGTVKLHEPPAHGQIAEISRADGYGFIQTDDGRVYFNRASVLDGGFDELTPGALVTFVEEQGDKGPQASTVRVLGKHHYVGDWPMPPDRATP